MVALSGSLSTFTNGDPSRRWVKGEGGGFEDAGAYSRRGMRCGPHRATRLNLFRIGLRSISVALRLDSSRAGFGSAILEPRKARIYTEALARL
jgi:hypothetical protein